MGRRVHGTGWGDTENVRRREGEARSSARAGLEFMRQNKR